MSEATAGSHAQTQHPRDACSRPRKKPPPAGNAPALTRNV